MEYIPTGSIMLNTYLYKYAHTKNKGIEHPSHVLCLEYQLVVFTFWVATMHFQWCQI
jgi:hypothetical protein